MRRRRIQNLILRYEETLQKEDLHPVTVKDNLTVIMEDVVFTIYPPEKLEYSRDKDNNRSLVTTVQHGDVRMFFGRRCGAGPNR